MTTSRTPLALTAAVGVLAGVAAGAGVFLGGGVGPFTFTNVQGDPVEMYGVGIYDHDSLMRGSGQRGVDVVTLFLVIPLMAVSAWLHRRGSLRGTLVLAGTLLWFTYAGISYVAAVAYNELFLVYVALFGTSFYAALLAFASVDRDELARRIGPDVPRRGPAAFLFAIGTFTLGIWLMTPLEGLLRGEPPSDLDSYTSMFTNGFDIAVIVPATFVAGALMLRRDPLGYAFGIPLVLFAGLLAPMVAAMTVFQVQAGVDFTTGAVVGPISGFIVLAAIAAWLLVVLLRHVGETVPGPTPLRSRTLVR
jgi:hypothetical protein